MELFGGDGKKESVEKENCTGRVIGLVDLGTQEQIFLMKTELIFFFVAESVYIICNVANE